MITKTIALMLSLSFTIMYDTISTPTIISIDIEYCDVNKAFEKSICTIQEAESKSNNRLLIDQKGNLKDILIDRRSMTSEKADAIFGNGTITIEYQNVINLPHLRKSILIRAGEYKVTKLRQGYKIEIAKELKPDN